MAWALVGGAAVSLVGNVAGGSMDAKNSAQQRQEDREFQQWQTEAGRQDQMFNAELGREQYGAEAYNRTEANYANAQNQAAMGMHASKYNVANQQARYDEFQKEFGDIKDNVNNYFRTLSASSVKAQNIDDINSRMAGVDARLSQTMSERGISSGSGIAIQAIGQAMAQGEVSKVMANRNVETEIAQSQSQFLTAQANDPLLARAPDFEAGMLTDAEKDQFATKANTQTTYDLPQQQALPNMPAVEAPKATGISGFLGSIF